VGATEKFSNTACLCAFKYLFFCCAGMVRTLCATQSITQTDSLMWWCETKVE